MSKESKEQNIIYFAENICGIKLVDWQKDLLRQKQEANDKRELILVNLGRRQGRQLVNNILISFQIWSKSQHIAELEEQLKNARKETAKKVIDRVEELSVFDFKAYEEHDLRKYIITELALDVILREFQGENK